MNYFFKFFLWGYYEEHLHNLNGYELNAFIKIKCKNLSEPHLNKELFT